MRNREGKLSYEDFFRKAILRLRDLSKSRGIHSVFSGFNQAFREYYGEDPVSVTQELARHGRIEILPSKRGVMMYLPGEAPKRSTEGQKVLSKILREPTDSDNQLIEQVLNEIAPNGPKTFPQDFLEHEGRDREFSEITVPGTPLQIDPYSQATVISPRRHFRYDAKNPPEAKYIIFAHEVGERSVKMPSDNREVFKMVIRYEKYCSEMRNRCFELFLELTNDEDKAQYLTTEIIKRLVLRA